MCVRKLSETGEKSIRKEQTEQSAGLIKGFWKEFVFLPGGAQVLLHIRESPQKGNASTVDPKYSYSECCSRPTRKTQKQEQEDQADSKHLNYVKAKSRNI